MSAAEPSPLEKAYELAKAHNMKIFPCSERVRGSYPTQYVQAYVVYRNHVRLGRRTDPSALLAFIKRLIPKPAAQC